jgi:FkbM family methyltransferase
VKNVVAHRLALSDAPGRALLYQSRSNRGGLSLARGNMDDDPLPPVEVEVGVADDVLRAISTPISLAKIDVQGAEARVMRGMRGLLSRNPDMVLLFEFDPHSSLNSAMTPARCSKGSSEPVSACPSSTARSIV